MQARLITTYTEAKALQDAGFNEKPYIGDHASYFDDKDRAGWQVPRPAAR
jgi:hypothetical protein